MIALLLRSLKGGRRQFMELAHHTPKLDPKLGPIVADWDRMKPALRNVADLDALCEAYGVDPTHFIGVVCEAELKFRGSVSILVAALKMPAVVAASVRTAKKKTGVADRKMLFEHAGFLPVPRGKQIRMLNHAVIKTEENKGCGDPLPSFESTVAEIEELLRDDK